MISSAPVSISIFLDTRRKKSNGKYPVKLRVYNGSTRKQKLYSTSFDMTVEEFRATWQTEKPRKKYWDLRRKLREMESRAIQIAQNLEPFEINLFEKRLFRSPGEGISLGYHYNRKVARHKMRGSTSTAEVYALSIESIST